MSHPDPRSMRDLLELVLGYGLIIGVIWMPEAPQRISSLLVLIVTLAVLLIRLPNRDELGLGWRGFLPSLWILPAAIAVAVVSVLVAKQLGTLHPLFNSDARHIAGYILWTLYQQILLNDYFLARLTRLLRNGTAAVSTATVMFAAAHLPSPWLTLATLIWGAISCALFRRYRNLYALGLAQGLLGLCFAVCVPDALHHHLRVGLGYLRYHAAPPVQ